MASIQLTQLSTIATPGARYSLSGPHTGLFTTLSTIAGPGARYSFSPKTPAEAPSHTGLFTELSLIGVPGGIHVFSPKEAYVEPSEPEVPPTAAPIYGGGGTVSEKYYDTYKHLKLKREDDEILKIIVKMVTSGILDVGIDE